jgi:hypothetical protein
MLPGKVEFRSRIVAANGVMESADRFHHHGTGERRPGLEIGGKGNRPLLLEAVERARLDRIFRLTEIAEPDRAAGIIEHHQVKGGQKRLVVGQRRFQFNVDHLLGQLHLADDLTVHHRRGQPGHLGHLQPVFGHPLPVDPDPEDLAAAALVILQVGQPRADFRIVAQKPVNPFGQRRDIFRLDAQHPDVHILAGRRTVLFRPHRHGGSGRDQWRQSLPHGVEMGDHIIARIVGEPPQARFGQGHRHMAEMIAILGGKILVDVEAGKAEGRLVHCRPLGHHRRRHLADQRVGGLDGGPGLHLQLDIVEGVVFWKKLDAHQVGEPQHRTAEQVERDQKTSSQYTERQHPKSQSQAQ